MDCVREQREALRVEAADHLDHGVRRGQEKSGRERTALSTRAWSWSWPTRWVLPGRAGGRRDRARSSGGTRTARCGIIEVMRLRISALVAVLAAASAVAVVVAVASPSANGLPAYTNGYAKWPRSTRSRSPAPGRSSSAHAGVKNVYASRKKVGKRYPNGTVIVKSIRRAGDKPSLPAQVAVMRRRTARGATSSTNSPARAIATSASPSSCARAAICGHARTTTCSRSSSRAGSDQVAGYFLRR